MIDLFVNLLASLCDIVRDIGIVLAVCLVLLVVSCAVVLIVGLEE